MPAWNEDGSITISQQEIRKWVVERFAKIGLDLPSEDARQLEPPLKDWHGVKDTVRKLKS